MDNLFVKITATLDKIKSAKSIKEALAAIKGLFVSVEGRLDKAKTKRNLKADLDKIPLTTKVEGKLDKNKTKQGIKSDLSKMDGLTTEVVGDLDTSKTKKQLKAKIKELSVDGTVNLNADESGNLARDMDSASAGATGLFAKLKVGVEVLNALRNAAREAVKNIKELDKQKTDIRMVTGSSVDEIDRLMRTYNQLAKEMGSTTVQVAQGASAWLRQGKTISETNELLRQSMILSKVGGMDSATATDRLTSALNGYKLSASQASDVVNKLAAVDLSAAVSSDEVSEALSRTASSASLAGISLDKIIGYITTVQEVTRKSASTIGESMKSIFARMGKVKLGFFDDDGEDISQVETTLKALDIQLRSSNQEFRDFDEVLDDVGGRWESFSSVQQRAIASAFAGVYQSENFLTLMNNYGKALEYTEVAANSAGTAMQKFGVYQEGLEAKTNRFVAAFESLSVNTINSGLVKGIVDSGTALITVIDKLGLVQAGLAGLATAGALKGITAIKVSAIEASKDFAKMSEAMNLVKTINPNSNSAVEQLGQSTKGLSDAQLKLILTSGKLRDNQLRQVLVAQGLSEAQAAAKLQTLGLATAEGVATASTNVLTGAWLSLKAAFLSNPIGWVLMGLSLAIPLVTKVFDALNVTVEEHREELNNLKSEYQDITSSLQSVQGELDTTKTRIEELLAKDTLTLYEQEELDRLIATNDELERQIQLLEIEQKLKSGDVNRKFIETFRKDVEDGGEHGGYVALAPNDPATAIEYVPKDEKQFIDEQIQSYNIRKAEIERLENELLTVTDEKIRERLNSQLATEEKGLSEIESYLANRQAQFRKDTEGISYIPEPADADEQAVNDALDFINDFYDKVAIAVEGDSYKATAFRRIYSKDQFADVKEELSDLARQGQLTEDTLSNPKYDGFVDGLSSVGISAKEATDQINSFVSASQNQPDDLSISVSVDQLEEARKATDSLVTSTKTLSSAFEEQRESGRLSAETILGIVDAGYAAALQVDQETGAVTINQQAYLALAQAKIQEQIASLQTDRAAIVAELETEKSAALNLAGAYLEEAKAKIIAKQDSVDSIDAQIRALDTVKSSLGSVVTGYYHVGNAAKQAADEMKKAFQSAQSAINTLLDMTMKMVKQRYEDEKRDLQDQMDDLKDRYDAEKDDLEDVNKEKEAQYKRDRDAIENQKKDLKAKLDAELEILRVKKEEYYWDKETKENNKTISELTSDLEIAKKDDSLEGLARQKELQDQLAQAEEEWKDKQFDHDIEQQEDTLQNEFDFADEKYQNQIDNLERIEELRKADHQAELDRIEDEYQSKRDALDREIQDISDYVAIEGNIRGEAIDLIEGKSQALYDQLMIWNNLHGDSLTSTLQIAWANGYAALETYNNGQLNVRDTLNDLALRMDNFVDATNRAANAMWNLADAQREADKYHGSIKGYEGYSSKAIKQEIKDLKKRNKDGYYDGKIKELEDWLKSVDGYDQGGVDTTGGLKMMHGSSTSPEVVFNAIDAQKLYDYIHNAPDLVGNITRKMNERINAMNPMNTMNFSSPSNSIGGITVHQGNVVVQGGMDKSALQNVKQILTDNANLITEVVCKNIMKQQNLRGHGNMKY